MDSDDQDDDEMLMERGDSDDDDEEMDNSYAKYLKLNYRDKMYQMQPSSSRQSGKKKKVNILSEPTKDTISKILDEIKITNNSIRKIQI